MVLSKFDVPRQQSLRKRLPRKNSRRQLFLESLEDRRLLVDDLQVVLQLFDTSNVPIVAPVTVGTEVVLQARVKDLRAPAFGVASTYLDLLFPSNVALVPGSVSHGGDYNLDPQNGTAIGTTIIDIGGADTNTVPPSGAATDDEFVLFSVHFTANTLGTGSFTAIVGGNPLFSTRLFPETGFLTVPPAGVTINAASLTVEVAPNAPPTATNLNAAETYTEDTALNLTDIVVSDADSPNVTATLTLSNPAAGSLNTGTSGAVTSTFVAGVWTASGALADVNTLLAALTFTPTLNFNGNFNITTSVNDGTAPAITGSKAMTGTPVNDPPTATNLNTAEAFTEDTALNLTDIVASDVDSVNVTATLTLSNLAAGSLNTGTSGAVTSTFAAGVWTASGALADVNTLLAALTFTPTLDFNGNFNIATSVSDSVAPAVTGSKAMTGTPVNDAPTATNLSAAETYTEDTAINLTDIVVTDVDSPNVTATLTLSNLAAGSLNTGTSGAVTSTFAAGVWTASGALADVNTLLAALTFTPTLDFNGNFTIATSVADGTAPAVTGSKAMTGTPVNDAPTATNLSAAETYTEDTPINLTDIVVTDVDSPNVTATLTLSNAAAGSLNTGTSGTVTSTFAAGVWTASGALADVNALLAAVTFTPTLDFNGNFTIATSVTDGTAPAVTGSKAMTGTPVNDAPTATNLSTAETYTQNSPLNLVDIVTSDVDSPNLTVTLTLSNPAAGSLNTGTAGAVTSTFAAGVWTASGAIADVNTLLAALTFTPALNFSSNFTIATSVSDGLAAAVTGSKAMTGSLGNIGPTATNLNTAETYTEDTALNLTDMVVSDADSPNVTVTLTLSNLAAGSLNTGTSGAVTSTFAAGVWTASGALADVNTLLAALTFTPALNFNSNFNIATSVSDGVAAAATGSKAMTGTPVNDAPTATNLSAAETYTEDTFHNLTDIVVSDVDSPNVTVTLTLSNVAAGSLNTGTSGAVTSTFAAGVWTANGALADVNTLLAGLTFTPTLNFNSNFTIATSVTDTVAPAVTGSKAMTGTAVNDAPTATNLNTAETYTEDTALNLTDIVVSDVDSNNITVTLTLSNIAAGSLNAGTSGAVTSTFAAGVWTASGALADVNTLLAALTFTPALNFNSNFNIATSVNDGAAPAVTGSKAMTGTPVNDAPTATNLSAAESYTEDTALNLTNIVVTDVDSPNVTATLTLSNLAAGSLNTGTSGAVTSTFAAGVWTATGALADVNTLLAGVTFTPTLNFSGNFNIATSVTDNVAPAITGSKAMTGTAANDAPTATNLNTAETYTEDTALNLTDMVVTDGDSPNVTVTLTLSNTAAGSLNTGTSGAVTSTFAAGVWTASGALADVNTLLAGVTFTPSLNFNGNFNIATSVTDSVAPAVTGSKAMTGTAVNDAPVFALSTAQPTVNEDATAQSIAAFATGIGPGGGTDEAGQTPSFSLTAGATTGNLTFSAAPAISSTGTLSFTPTANTNGTATFTVLLQDNGGTANGGVNSSTTRNFTITVNAVNDVPSFTIAGNPPVTSPGAGVQTVTNFATNLTRGGGSDEASQALTFLVLAGATTGNLAFTTAPAISSTGTLTYTTAPNTAGTATFTVALKDDGGTANGGVDTTATQTFTITVGLSSLSGVVFCDIDGDGTRDTGELLLPNVLITLTGTNSANAAVTRTVRTGTDGTFRFGDLLPGTYNLSETQPTGFMDGPEQLGTLNGTVGNDQFTAIVVTGSANGTGYTFRESGLDSSAVGMHLALCSTAMGEKLAAMLIPPPAVPLRAAPAALLANAAVRTAPPVVATPLRIEAVPPLVRAAINRFSRIGITPAQQTKLAAVQVQVADLPDDQVGSTTGNVVTLDVNAADLGWFVDPTPETDVEFETAEQAPQGIDLLSVISHELGHVLGLGHSGLNGDDLLDEYLQPSQRKSPQPELLDALFAEDDWAA